MKRRQNYFGFLLLMLGGLLSNFVVSASSYLERIDDLSLCETSVSSISSSASTVYDLLEQQLQGCPFSAQVSCLEHAPFAQFRSERSFSTCGSSLSPEIISFEKSRCALRAQQGVVDDCRARDSRDGHYLFVFCQLII